MDPLSAVTGSVKDALRLGCVAVGYTIYPGSAAAPRSCTSSCREIIAGGQGATGSPRWCGPIRAAPDSQQGRRDGDRRRRLRGADRGPARRPRHQGEAAHRAHRAGRGQEGLREGQDPDGHPHRARAPRGAVLLQRPAASSSSRAGRPRRTTSVLRRVPRHPRRRGVRLHHRPQRVPAPARPRAPVPGHGDEDLLRREEAAAARPAPAPPEAPTESEVREYLNAVELGPLGRATTSWARST